MTHVTNGVHVPSWDSASADQLWTEACGKGRWLSTLDAVVEDFKKVSAEALWELRLSQTRELLSYVRERHNRQLLSGRAAAELVKECGQHLDPDVLTVGFARRFTGYKRPHLLLHDPQRLARIINQPQRPIQLIIAGKAHPLDLEGKALVREWWEFSIRPDVRGRVVYLADYDMDLAAQLVRGIDLWVNTPRRPWEACGTSGMKVLVNGGLNLSELDGWWAEAYRSEVGWAIGDGLEHGEDPGWDAREAEELYRVLEDEIIPCFYDRDQAGIPQPWVARMRASMAELTPRFSANRMVREYVDTLYSVSARRFRRRTADGAKEAALLCRWREALLKNWSRLCFGNLDIRKSGDSYIATVAVHLGEIDPRAVRVELYAEPLDGEEAEIHPMEAAETAAATMNGRVYRTRIPARRPAGQYTPRIVPFFDGAVVPLEAPFILWREG